MIDTINLDTETDPLINPTVIIIAGANAVGKGSIVKSLLNDPDTNTASIVRHTTRPMDAGEVDGQNYHFVHDSEAGLGNEIFESYVLDGAMLEYAKYLPGYYGTSIIELEQLIDRGINPILDVDIDAGLAIRKVLSSREIPCLDFYIIPIRMDQLQTPSGQDLYITEIIKRLKSRNRRFDLEPAEIQDRIVYAVKWLEKLSQYHFVIENLDDEMESAVQQIKFLIKSKVGGTIK